MVTSVRFAESMADREAIFRLRFAIYGEELGRGHAGDGDRRMRDDLDDTARLLLAEHEGQAVGTMRLNWGGDGPFGAADRAIYGLDELEAIVPAQQIVIFSRFATNPNFRGGDLPGQLIDAMVRFAIAKGVSVILCDCRPELINVYLRLGMRVRGPVVTTPGVGILVPLVLFLDDIAHIRSTHSRIAPLLCDATPDLVRRDAVLRLLPGDPVVQTLEQPDQAPDWTQIIGVLTAISPVSFPIFSGLASADIARLMTRANVIACSPGDLILRQGSRGEMVFVVLDGTVAVKRGDQVISELHPGSVFGEVAFLARIPRTADVVSAGHSRLVCLRASMLSTLIAKEPDVAAPFLYNLSRILALRIAGSSVTMAAAEPVS